MSKISEIPCFQENEGKLELKYDSINIKNSNPLTVEFVFHGAVVAKINMGKYVLGPGDTLHIRELTGNLELNINFPIEITK